MRYDAFISYRHAEADMYVAKKLHKMLETYKVPRAVVKKSGKKKIERVFRDQEELPIGSDLGSNIETALAESEFLIVVCSPRLLQSSWCMTEIDTFIQLHDRNHVLAILVEGEPEEAFPKQLCQDENGNPIEPLAADVRGATKAEINKKMKTEVMRLLAPLLGCTYDDLRQRHKERRMRRIVAASALVAALAIAFGGYSAYNTAMIQKNYKEKQVNQSKYLAKTAQSLYEEGDRENAVLVALEALPSEDNDRPYVAEAQNALSTALEAYSFGEELSKDRVLQHDLPVYRLAYNKECDKLITCDSGNYVYVWDVATGAKLAQIAPQCDDSGYTAKVIGEFCISNDTIVMVEMDELLCVDFDGNVLWEKTAPGRDTFFSYTDAFWDSETDRIVALDADYVDVWDGTSGELITSFANTNTEATYRALGDMASESDYVAVSKWTTDTTSTTGYVTICQISTGESKEVVLPFSYTSCMKTCGDVLYVVGQNHMYDAMDTEADLEALAGTDADQEYLVKIDCATGEILWQRQFDTVIVTKRSGYNLINAVHVDDTDSDIVGFAMDSTFYGLDGETGEILSSVSLTEDISQIYYNAGSFAFLGDYTGKVYVVDSTSGTVYTSNTMETSYGMMDFLIRKGCLAYRVSGSTEVTLMKYIQGENCSEVAKYDGYIDGAAQSPDGMYYAISENTYGTDLSADYHIYNAADDTEVSEITVSCEDSLEYTGFIHDHDLLVVSYKGEVWIYDPATGENTFHQEAPQSQDSLSSLYGEVTMAENDAFFILHAGSRAVLFDLTDMKYSKTIEFQDYMNALVIGEDKETAFGISSTDGFGKVDLDTGVLTSIGEEYAMTKSADCQDKMALDTANHLLAVACQDGVLRVYNYEEEKTVAEIPFSCMNKCLLGILDGDRLYAQGDDGILRVYSIADQSYVYISADAYDTIYALDRDDAGETITLRCAEYLYILDGDSFSEMATIPYGRAYMATAGKVIVGKNYTIYSFPFKTLEMLKEEAAVQFPDASLSDQERARFNVD